MLRHVLAVGSAFALTGFVGGPAASAPDVAPSGTATPTPVACMKPDVAARTLHAALAEPTPEMVRYGVGGRVIVLVTVGADGRVTAARAASTSSGFLVASALAAARASTFAAEISGCVPVEKTFAFIVDFDVPQPAPLRTDPAAYFPGAWRCTAANGETRTLIFVRNGHGLEESDGTSTTSAAPDPYHMWRIYRNGRNVGWAFPWVDETWAWSSHVTTDKALRYRRVDDATFELTTAAGSALATIEKSERCARLAKS